jgi:hypothetical protein
MISKFFKFLDLILAMLIVAWGLFLIFSVLVVGLFLSSVGFRPEHYHDTEELREQAPAIFRRTTDVPYPENATIDYVMWSDAGPDPSVLHLILDASRMDLGDWIKKVRPFGIPLERVTPELPIEGSDISFLCGENDPKIDRAEESIHQLVYMACQFIANPHEVWMAQGRDHMDRMRTVIVDEDAKMIWLQGS